jgi:DNA-binding NtrC family response regulator
VILLTGFPEHPKAKQVADIGFTHIYAKPFNSDVLMRVVDQLLKENEKAMMQKNPAE